MYRTPSLVAVLIVASVSVPAQCPNTALQFDGIDDVVMIPDDPSLDGFTDFTIELWCRESSTAPFTNLCMVSKGSSYWWYISDQSLWFSAQSPGGGGSDCSTLFPNDGLWHHVAVSRSGLTTSCYIDGTLAHSNTSGLANPIFDSNDTLRIGNANGTCHGGGLDEIRIWSISRSPAQIQAAMSMPLSGSEFGLVAYYDFQSGAGQTVVDVSGNGNDGVLGATSAPGADDPLWSSIAPTLGCNPPMPTSGQANSADARLEVNAVPTGTTAGPFVANLVRGQLFSFDWYGDPNQPYILLGSSILNPGNTVVPGFGSLDIGSPPAFPDIFLIFDGLTSPGSLFYQLDSMGEAHLSYTVPLSLNPGPLFTVQGAVVQAPPLGGGFWIQLTAAHTLVVQ